MKAWEANIRKVVPYVPGEQPKKDRMIKLNTNENPYGPAPGVKAAAEHMDLERLRLYPDPTADLLVSALAERYGLNKDFCGRRFGRCACHGVSHLFQFRQADSVSRYHLFFLQRMGRSLPDSLQASGPG